MASEPRKRTRPTSEYVCPGKFLQSWNYDAFHAIKLPKVSLEKEEEKVAEETEAKTLQLISKMMSVNHETVQELEEVCGKHTLYSGNEPKNTRDLLSLIAVPESIQLDSVRYQIEQRKQRHEDPSFKVACDRQMKYNTMDDYMIILPEEAKNRPDNEFQVPMPNVIIIVQITKCFQKGQIPTRFREMETFQVLGTQSLCDLRDKIKCSTDSVIAGDYSTFPDVDTNTLECAGDLYKSSCFFIENCFYNDTRLAENIDYSKNIREWAKKEIPEREFLTGKMEKTTFNDLKIKLGQHYLFIHQGNCEHSVMFTDIRLHNSEDIQDIRQYPHLYCTRIKNRSVCQCCNKFSARWIVHESEITPSDPGFLCKMCFKFLCYDKNGKKKSDFKAYHLIEKYNHIETEHTSGESTSRSENNR